MRGTGIRFKMVASLLLAVGVPLAAGLISIHLLGRRYYRADKGQLFQAISQYLSVSLRGDIDNQVALLRNWIQTSDLADQIDQGSAAASPEDEAADIAAMERRWPALKADDDDVRRRLDNPVARRIRRFQGLNPRFAEILVTDARGRLAAASNKSSDFFQADETWWQRAVRLEMPGVWIEGISFDDSAGVYSVDIAMPLTGTAAGQPPAGVLKCVLDVSPLFGSIERILQTARTVREVVLDDGRILVRFFDASVAPLRDRIHPALATEIRRRQNGWLVAPAHGSEPALVGFSRIRFKSQNGDETDHAGLVPMYVIVHDTVESVMAPVQRQLLITSASGGVLIVVFLLAGLYITDRKIVNPIRLLRRAAQGIATQARLRDAETLDGAALPPQPDSRETAERIEAVTRIRAHDEIGDLTHDFMLMARRVLRYHEQLETELNLKTEEIEKDLMVAREFQEALLPSRYPTVPSPRDADPMALDFYHVYKPATSVSGDFFHMIQLSDHEAGVFIADVMGHGARSALISAILRTLLQNAAHETRDPAELMGSINRQFRDILPRGSDIIFATAFYAVFDTSAGRVRCMSAGHPSPFRIRPSPARVDALLDATHTGPALGLIDHPAYRSAEHPLHSDDVFLLYTDGVVEAPNVRGEEFGEMRLRRVMERQAGASGETIANAVISALHGFMDVVISPDDICLVTVGIRERKRETETPAVAPPAPRLPG